MQDTSTLIDNLIDEVQNSSKNNKLNNNTFYERLKHIASNLSKENDKDNIKAFIDMCNNKKIAQEYSKEHFENVLNQLNAFKRKYNDIMTKETEKKEEVQENVEEKIEINKEEYVKDLIKDTTKMVNVTNNLNEFINGFNIIDCLVGILSGDEKYFKKNTKPLEFTEQEKKDILNEIYNGIDDDKKEKFLESLNTFNMSSRIGVTVEDINKKEIEKETKSEESVDIDSPTEVVDNTNDVTDDNSTDITDNDVDEEKEQTENKGNTKENEEEKDPEELIEDEELSEEVDKPIKFRHKVVKVVKNTHEWFKKHPIVRILAIGLAILATLPLTAQPIMMVFSTLWHLCNTSIIFKPLCPLFHGLNVGLAPFVKGGKFAFDLAGSGLYTLGGASGAQAMYTAAQAAIFTALSSLGVAGAIIARKLRKKMKDPEPTPENPIPEEPTPKEPTPEEDKEKNKEKDNEKGKDGYNPELTHEQIEELKAEGLEPGDPEYIQYLHNHGITPRPEDYKKRVQKEETKYDGRLTKEQIDELKAEGIVPGDNEYDMYLRNHGLDPIVNENINVETKQPEQVTTETKGETQSENIQETPKLEESKENTITNEEIVQENERLRKTIEIKDKKYDNLKATLAYVMKELEELKLKQNKEPLQIAESEEMSRGPKM